MRGLIAPLFGLGVTVRFISEREIAGYRDVLGLIHESYDYMLPNASIILQMHSDMYRYSPSSIGMTYKNMDNLIAERTTAVMKLYALNLYLLLKHRVQLSDLQKHILTVLTNSNIMPFY